MNARRTLSLVLIALAGCTHRSHPSDVAPKYALVPTPAAAPSSTSPAQAQPAGGAQTDVVVIEEGHDEVTPTLEGSYVLRAPSVVRVAPDPEAVALGVLAVGTRLPRQEPVEAAGCRGVG